MRWARCLMRKCVFMPHRGETKVDKETTRVIDAENRTVEAIVSVRTSKDAPEQTFTWILDYSKVDLASLLEKASRTDVITLQARYRTKPFDQRRFNIATDIVERPRLTDKERVKRAIEKLGITPEEILEIAKAMKGKK